MRGQRRIPVGSARAGDAQDAQQVLRQSDLDTRFLTLTRGGRVTLNMAQVIKALTDSGVTFGTAAADVDEFEGAGSTGLVPDPASESARYLRDNGEWDTPSGGGDMLKASYDTGSVTNGVDKAEQLEGPSDGLNISTAANVRSHLDSTSNPHSVDGTNGGVGGVGVYDGTTSSGLEFRNVIEVAADGVDVALNAGNKEIEIGLNERSVPVSKLTPHAGGQHVLVSDEPQPRDPEWLQVPDFGVILKKNTSASAGIETDAAVNNEVLMRGTAGAANNLGFKPMLRLVDSLLDSGAFAGSSFPSTFGSPQNGQLFYRTDLGMMFAYYAGSINDWLSVAEWTVDAFGDGTTGYLNDAGGTAMSSSYGFSFRFDVVCVELEVVLGASGTGTWEVYDDGAATGETVSTSSATQATSQKTNPPIIVAGSIIAINQTSGSVTTPRVRATFRRLET